MDSNLKGKNAIVTGAASGMGAAIATELAKEGVNIILNYRSREVQAVSLAKRIEEIYGVICKPVKADMANKADLDTLFKTALDTLGELDILVNNAGVWPTAYVAEMTVEDFESTLGINLVAPFVLCKKMVNHLVEKNKKGKIINMVSQAAFLGSTTGHAHYAASKAGLVSFTISLAREVAKKGINCNCVAPGIARTPMMENNPSQKDPEEYYKNRIPLGRIAEPEEVAYTVVFLASDKSDYITGATIDVSGGMLMR